MFFQGGKAENFAGVAGEKGERPCSRLLTGERLTRRDIVALAHGGLCRSCPECHYPRCSFGLAGAGNGAGAGRD